MVVFAPAATLAAGAVTTVNADASVPVSYTHLDVYKRQLLQIVTLVLLKEVSFTTRFNVAVESQLFSFAAGSTIVYVPEAV